MSKRPKQKNRFEPRQKPEQTDMWNPHLSLEHKVGIYARQSTQAQVIKNVQSAEMQTTDLLDIAQQLGWKDDQVILYIENRREDGTIKNASGALRIDQRPGLQALCERIDHDEIKAVIVAQVDRLFRDETMLGPDTFIDKCKRHGCLVATLVPDTIFDFRNTLHVKMFRFLAETAAEYITYHVKGRLHAAKERLARSGRYAGYGSVPMGYIVDRQKLSPTYRKYIPYEPHVTVIRWLFRRFRELGGNIGALCRELEAMPYIFPEFPDKSYETLRRLTRVPGGFHLTRYGLIMLLTNPVYIGWWVFMGVTYSKTNHESLVDEEVFWYAYNHLAEYTPEGEKMEREKRQSRYIQRDTEDVHALLKDVVKGSNGVVYTHKHGLKPDEYILIPPTPTTTARGRVHIMTSEIDSVFTSRLFKHLRTTHTFDQYRDYLKEQKEEQKSQRTTMSDQLRQIDITQETIIDDRLQLRKERLAQIPPIEEESPLEKRLKVRFNKLEEQKSELRVKLSQLETTTDANNGMSQLADFHTELEKLIPAWEKKSVSDRRGLVNALVKEAILDYMTPRWVRLVVDWVHPDWGTDLFYIYRNWPVRIPWIAEEEAVIKELYATGDREEIIRLLPHRSLEGIRDRAALLRIPRAVVIRESLSIPKFLSMQDWVFMQEQGISKPETVITKVDKPPTLSTQTSPHNLTSAPIPIQIRGMPRIPSGGLNASSIPYRHTARPLHPLRPA